MRLLPLLLGHAFCAAFFAGLFVVAVYGQHEFVFFAWLCVLGISLIDLNWRRYGVARGALLVQTTIAVAVVSLAAAAPVKTRDRLLGGRVILPSAEMSLGELRDYAEGAGRRSFPVRIQLSYPESRAGSVLRWPASEMTLKEFLTTIEGQTQLRHQFGSCGNGSTILWGGNCCFGVFLRTPGEPG